MISIISINMEYSKTYDKCNVPDSYLSDLFNYLKRNQYIKGTDDYNSFTLSIKSEMPALENLKSKCIYTYFLNNDWDEMINEVNLINNSKLHCENLRNLVDLLKEFVNEQATYNETKKGVILIFKNDMVNGLWDLPIFIDDIAMKFRIIANESGEIFDTSQYE